jgi:hypothetical protein
VKSPEERAADYHNTMAVLGAPKPTKGNRPPKAVKAFKQKYGHSEKKTVKLNQGTSGKSTVKSIPTRKILVEQIEDVHHRLVHWRDGLQCVLRNVDGRHCGGGPQWGHVIPQGQSAYLRWNLSNVFDQCRDHNSIHTRDQSTYHNWYIQTFGANAFDKLNTAKLLNQNGHKFYVDDLAEILSDLLRLYEEIYQYSNATMEQLVDAGYYGPIILAAWIEDGRLEKVAA